MSSWEEKADQPVGLEKQDHTAIIRIQNPPVNVLTGEVLAAIQTHLQTVRQDPDVAVVVFTAAGERAFMAGAGSKGFPAPCGGPGGASRAGRTG